MPGRGVHDQAACVLAGPQGLCQPNGWCYSKLQLVVSATCQVLWSNMCTPGQQGQVHCYFCCHHVAWYHKRPHMSLQKGYTFSEHVQTCNPSFHQIATPAFTRWLAAAFMYTTLTTHHRSILQSCVYAHRTQPTHMRGSPHQEPFNKQSNGDQPCGSCMYTHTYRCTNDPMPTQRLADVLASAHWGIQLHTESPALDSCACNNEPMLCSCIYMYRCIHLSTYGCLQMLHNYTAGPLHNCTGE